MTSRTPAQYDWDKALFNDRRLTKHFTSPRRSTIKTVTLHHMTIVVPGSGSGTTTSLEGCYRTWQTREASANYGVSGDQVWQYVSDNDAAWANASSSNHETLSIEHTNSTAGPSWKVSDETMATGAKLVAYLHKLYKMGRPSRKTVKMHRDYYATACPGPYMVDHLASYIAEAARVYDTIGTDPKPPVVTQPPPAAKPVVLRVLHWNIAGSDTVNGYAKTNGTRGPAVGKWAKEIGFDVFAACEAGQTNLRAGINTILGTAWSSHAKAFWTTDLVTITTRKAYADNTFNYLRSVKYGAGIFGTKGGKKFGVLEIHTDWRKPAKQAKQVQSLWNKFILDAYKYGVPVNNLLVAGDFNPDGTSDNPFKALTASGFVEQGDTKQATFLDGRHLDGVLARITAKLKVTRKNRANTKGVRLSDHYPLVAEITLT